MLSSLDPFSAHRTDTIVGGGGGGKPVIDPCPQTGLKPAIFLKEANLRRKIELQSEEINTLKSVIVGLVTDNARLGLDNQRFIRKVEELQQLIKAIS